MLLAIIGLIFTFGAFASSHTQTFFYDGSQDTALMSLRAEKTHIEYRYEQRQTICYRREVFYRTICQSGPNGQTFCHTVPEYRTVSFPCIQTVQVPYEVKDYDVEANVDISVAGIQGIPAGETFKVTLSGDQLSLEALGSKKFFILLMGQKVSSIMSGSVKFMTASYKAKLVEAAPIVNALDVKNISIKDSLVSFKMGPVAAREAIGFHLMVKKAPLLGSDTVLFDRDLTSSEIQLSTESAGSAADVNIEKLGVQLSSGRHTITATAFFKHQGTILNESDFERTEASRTLIYKL